MSPGNSKSVIFTLASEAQPTSTSSAKLKKTRWAHATMVLATLLRVFLSAIAAIVLTAVLFVLLHELGEPDGTIVWKLVATRFIVPGVVMGSLYLLFGPGFVIAMHSTMHVMIPLLFN